MTVNAPHRKLRYWAWKQLRNNTPEHCHFHSLDHSREVYKLIIPISSEMGIHGEDLENILTAAAFNNIGFTENTQDHEVRGAEIFERQAKLIGGLDYFDIETISGLIRSTRFPNQVTNDFEAILHDANSYYLGTERYIYKAHALRSEMHYFYGQMTDASWRGFQIDMLQNHTYFTPAIAEMLEKGKLWNLARVKNNLSQLSVAV